MKKNIVRALTGIVTAGSLFGVFFGAVSGCDAVATKDPGVFVPNAEGGYTLRSVTEDCSDQFDTEVNVIQDGENLIIKSANPSFTDLTGTIDSDGVVTAGGASTFGAPFECEGQFADGTLSGVCVSGVETCTVDETTGEPVCTTADISCGFSFERI